MTDEEIVLRVRSGDTRPFSELVERYQDRVFGLALRFTGDRGEAEEIAQEVFLKAFRGLSSFRGDSQISTWIHRITGNQCIDWQRKKKRKRATSAPLEEGLEIPDERESPERAFAQSEEARVVSAAVASLPARYRDVVSLYYEDGRTYEQIGERLHVPVKTVETRLYRARKLLRERLSDSRAAKEAQ